MKNEERGKLEQLEGKILGKCKEEEKKKEIKIADKGKLKKLTEVKVNRKKYSKSKNRKTKKNVKMKK